MIHGQKLVPSPVVGNPWFNSISCRDFFFFFVYKWSDTVVFCCLIFSYFFHSLSGWSWSSSLSFSLLCLWARHLYLDWSEERTHTHTNLRPFWEKCSVRVRGGQTQIILTAPPPPPLLPPLFSPPGSKPLLTLSPLLSPLPPHPHLSSSLAITQRSHLSSFICSTALPRPVSSSSLLFLTSLFVTSSRPRSTHM